MDISGFLEKLPNELDVLNWVVDKTQTVAAAIVAGLFVIGVFDFGLLIFENFRSGRITEVGAVIDLIEFLLLLFIIVEVYRTIVAYARNKLPKYVLTLVLYTGVIAIIRRIIVFYPSEVDQSLDALFISLGFAVILLSLGMMLFIVDQYGDTIEEANIFKTQTEKDDSEEQKAADDSTSDEHTDKSEDSETETKQK